MSTELPQLMVGDLVVSEKSANWMKITGFLDSGKILCGYAGRWQMPRSAVLGVMRDGVVIWQRADWMGK